MTLARLGHFKSQMKHFASQYRLPLYGIAVLIFFAGLYISLRNLKIDADQLSYRPLLGILLVTQPLLILFNSLELKLCALAAQSNMSLKQSIFVSNSATVANILPLPAGLVLRGAALVKGGAKVSLATKVLLIAAIMWIAVAATVSGAVIASGLLSALFIVFGGISILLLLLYASRLTAMRIALGFLGVRVLMVGLLTLQLKLCFEVLGANINLQGAAVYVVSGVAGAVVSVIPAGLGVIEGFGAFLAKLDGASSSTAYIVLSLSRIIGLAMAGLCVFIFKANGPKSQEEKV